MEPHDQEWRISVWTTGKVRLILGNASVRAAEVIEQLLTNTMGASWVTESEMRVHGSHGEKRIRYGVPGEAARQMAASNPTFRY